MVRTYAIHLVPYNIAVYTQYSVKVLEYMYALAVSSSTSQLCTNWHSFSNLPVQIVLGKETTPIGCGHKRRVAEVEETMVYIPVLDTLDLQRLLSNDALVAGKVGCTG